MLTILTTTDFLETIQSAIARVDRLDELVTVTTEAQTTEHTNGILRVSDGQISTPLPWSDQALPYLIPTQSMDTDHLLAWIFYALGNEQQAFTYLDQSHDLHPHVLLATKMKYGYEISPSEWEWAVENSAHNASILAHYAAMAEPLSASEIEALYQQAMNTATNDEEKLLTAKHYGHWLLDQGRAQEAEQVATTMRDIALSDHAQMAMTILLAQAQMQQLSLPHHAEELEQLLSLYDAGIAYHERLGARASAGLLLIDASEIANYLQDYQGSKQYINQAIAHFREEDIPEFLGEASLRKATLFYTWSKQGMPQFYKAAINAYQDTLKVFRKDSHPYRYAEVHHQLALVYSEIPVAPEEQAIWTAFSASSFKEALELFTADQFPYEHAMVCHNYATALINFPEAKLHNNYVKANQLFEQALSIRHADQYPTERLSSLVNQLELMWLLPNENEQQEQQRMASLQTKIEEIKHLTDDQSIREKLSFHEQKLADLKLSI